MKYLLYILTCLVPTVAIAETITILWDPPTTYTDERQIPPGELKEFRVFDQRKLIKIVPAPTVSAQVITSSGKSNAWEVTAVTQHGESSDYSNVVIWVPTPVPTPRWPPVAPARLRLNDQ